MTDIMVYIIVALANTGIGALIGMCGVAGFLLPMLYTAALGMPVSQALTLSFLAFLISGVLGSKQYYKEKQIELKFSLLLSLGSLVGALVGVRMNSMIRPEQVKILLYLVVFLSGLSILLRKEGAGGEKPRGELLKNKYFVPAFGFVTGTICALSGAGGPVLVMPLLVSLGMGVRMAVGTALFNSIFIAIPAIAGYAVLCNPSQIGPYIPLVILFHGVGVVLGSRNASRIPARPLKLGVAVFSIMLASYMIFNMMIL